MKKSKSLISLLMMVSCLTLVSCNETTQTTLTSLTTNNESTSNYSSSSSSSIDEPIETKKIEVENNPSKDVFTVGDLFSMDGLVVKKFIDYGTSTSSPVTVSETEYYLSIPEGTILEDITDDLVVTLTMYEEDYNSLSFNFVVKDKTKYTVSFENYDGERLGNSDVVLENDFASYSGETPTHPNGDNLYYSFEGFYVKGDDTKTIVDLSTYKITEDTTFVAAYSSSETEMSDGMFKYAIYDNSYLEITKVLNSSNTKVTIPDSYNGLPIKNIGEKVFYDNTNLTEVIIGANVENIKDNAFYSCTSLSKVEFKDRVATTLDIGDYSFFKCYSLKSITFPEGTRSIGKKAFDMSSKDNGGFEGDLILPETLEVLGENAFHYNHITSVNIPDSVVTFGESPFLACDSLQTIKLGANRSTFNYYECICKSDLDSFANYVVDETNQYFKAVDGILYSHDQTILVSVPCNNYKNNIEDLSTLLEFVVPESVITIGDHAFYDCAGYSKITLGTNVTEIDDYGLYSTTAAEVIFNSKLERIGKYGMSYNGTRSSQTSVVLPDSVKIVDDYAFANCNKFTSFTFGAGIEQLGMYIFKSATNLNKTGAIKFSKNSTMVNDDGYIYDKDKTVLYYNLATTSSTSYTLPSTVKEINGGVFYSNTKLKTLTIPSNSVLETIGMQAFYGMTNLACAISLPSTLKTIGDQAFQNCKKVTKFTFANSDNLISIGLNAFSTCSLATFDGLTLGPSLEYVGKTAFISCAKLTSVTVNTNLDLLNCFEKCTTLANVTFGENVTKISDSMFSGCTKLTSITLNENIKEIGTSAFASAGLTSIDLNHVETIGEKAFEKSKLVTVNVPSTVTSVGDAAFDQITTLTSMTFNASIASIPDNLLKGDTKLATFNTDQTYAGIGESAFESTIIDSFDFKEGLRVIGASAFKATNLTSVNIPSSLTSLGASAFQNCTSLSSVTFPSDFSYDLPNYLFYGCSSLNSFTIPSGVSNIGGNAFYQTSIISLDLTGDFVINTSTTSPFIKMADLESINFEGQVSFSSTIKATPSYFFQDDAKLTSITGLSNIEFDEISMFSFDGCSSLESIPFDTTKVSSIKSSALKGTSKLTNFDFSTTITELPNYAFQNSGIKELVLPSNITTINKQTFDSCTSLEKITINNPNISIYTSTYATAQSFSNCTNVKEIIFNGTPAQATAVLPSAKKTGFKEGTIVKCNDGKSFILY